MHTSQASKVDKLLQRSSLESQTQAASFPLVTLATLLLLPCRTGTDQARSTPITPSGLSGTDSPTPPSPILAPFCQKPFRQTSLLFQSPPTLELCLARKPSYSTSATSTVLSHPRSSAFANSPKSSLLPANPQWLSRSTPRTCPSSASTSLARLKPEPL
eukprot:05430_4